MRRALLLSLVALMITLRPLAATGHESRRRRRRTLIVALCVSESVTVCVITQGQRYTPKWQGAGGLLGLEQQAAKCQTEFRTIR